MTTVNLTTEQLEAITEAFAKGESVTLQPPMKQWEPKNGNVTSSRPNISRDSICGVSTALKEITTFERLLAYRDEFDPEYTLEKEKWNSYVYLDRDMKKYTVGADSYSTTDIAKVYMSEQVAKDLAAKLNSGEVVL